MIEDPKTWTLVLRNSKTGKTYIWNAKDLSDIMRRMNGYWREMRNSDWSREADNYLRANYGRFPNRELASVCTKLLSRRVTINAVIGRYHRIKGVHPNEIQYRSAPDDDTYIRNSPDTEMNTFEQWRKDTHNA